LIGTVIGVVLEVVAATLIFGGRPLARHQRARMDRTGSRVGAPNFFVNVLHGITLALVGIFCFGH
jgi:hypothetical protein